MDGYTENLVPLMTSQTTDNITVTSSSAYDSKFVSWKAFNRVLSTGDDGNCWVTTANTRVGWLKVDFGTDKNYAICKYTIQARDYPERVTAEPRDWTFEGSYDNSAWDVLDKQTNQINWTVKEKREYIFDNDIPYRYYRINITNNNGFTYLQLDEMELMARNIKYLIQQNKNIYSIDHNYLNLGESKSPTELSSWIDNYGYQDLNIINKSLDNKYTPTTVDDEMIYESLNIDFNDVKKPNIYVFEDDDKKKVRYDTDSYKIIDEIKKINNGVGNVVFKEY